MEIKFDKNIYTKNGILNTVEVYKNLADIDFSESDDFFIIVLKNIDEDVRDIIKDEFCNYSLFETVKCQ
ncbi:MAG: HxsD-like protein [Candidatus ainarchaeum sp.]|nr:HxsD-like protein [Candidatus ainarchaeum sp.]MDD3940516.1 HxsD-like protein [Candidatus Paceibacterota bacterium]MDD4468102.1 HxsD-like protein [Candidatus ainarchaeum sp.]